MAPTEIVAIIGRGMCFLDLNGGPRTARAESKPLAAGSLSVHIKRPAATAYTLPVMAVDHYENFPVASLLLPRHLRAAVRDIYRYARTADDIADEGDAAPQERLAALAEFHHALELFGQNPATRGPLPHAHIFEPLEATVRRHALPVDLLHDLLSAFEQDVVTQRYEDDTQLLDYCRRSANPVGRLLLHLYDRATDDNLRCSDAICTGLQLTNFWQDVAIDWHKHRVYLPQDALRRHGVPQAWIGRCARAGRLPAGAHPDAALLPAWRSLMMDRVQWARNLLLEGRPLTRRLPWRAGLELRLVIQGGLTILERLEQLNYDVFERRPILRRTDWLRMALTSIFQ